MGLPVRCLRAWVLALCTRVSAARSQSWEEDLEALARGLRLQIGGPEPPLAWAARMYEVANRELARGRRAPLVLRGLLDEEARQSLLALFEEEAAAGRLQGDQAHAPFRALSLSADLDEDFEGGRLRFYSEDGRESWLASEISLGDGLLFDSGTPHSVDPLARGNRTVLLYWFHAEPWGADPDSPVQQAYREHVEGLTNSDDAGNAELKRRLYRELVRWR